MARNNIRSIVANRMGILKTVGDNKVCEECQKKAGQTNETPPFHPNCRCQIVGNKVFNEAGVPIRTYEMGTYSPEGYKLR